MSLELESFRVLGLQPCPTIYGSATYYFKKCIETETSEENLCFQDIVFFSEGHIFMRFPCCGKEGINAPFLILEASLQWWTINWGFKSQISSFFLVVIFVLLSFTSISQSSGLRVPTACCFLCSVDFLGLFAWWSCRHMPWTQWKVKWINHEDSHD